MLRNMLPQYNTVQHTVLRLCVLDVKSGSALILIAPFHPYPGPSHQVWRPIKTGGLFKIIMITTKGGGVGGRTSSTSRAKFQVGFIMQSR